MKNFRYTLSTKNTLEGAFFIYYSCCYELVFFDNNNIAYSHATRVTYSPSGNSVVNTGR